MALFAVTQNNVLYFNTFSFICVITQKNKKMLNNNTDLTH